MKNISRKISSLASDIAVQKELLLARRDCFSKFRFTTPLFRIGPFVKEAILLWTAQNLTAADQLFSLPAGNQVSLLTQSEASHD